MSSEWTVQYHQRVLAMDPFAYWMLDEKSGAVAYDLVSGRVAGAQNGAHTGVTLGADGIGDGRACPLYDGANDVTNIYSVTFRGAFDGTEGTAAIWARVSAAGVWTDGSYDWAVRLFVDVNNGVDLYKTNVNNLFQASYKAGGTTKARNITCNETTWLHFVITWSASADKVIAYKNGVQEGATLTGLGVWAGNLIATATCLGASSTGPGSPWNGYLAHGAVWDRALSADEVADLAVIE